MVPPAQAAQVPAGGRSAVAVRDDVVEVATAGASPAAGHPAVPVADAHEAPLLRGRPVARGARRWTEPRAVGGEDLRRVRRAAGRGRLLGFGVRTGRRAGATAPARAAAQFTAGRDGDQPPGDRVADRDLDATAGRRAPDPEQVQLLEQLAALRGTRTASPRWAAGRRRPAGGGQLLDGVPAGHRRPHRQVDRQARHAVTDRLGDDIGGRRDGERRAPLRPAAPARGGPGLRNARPNVAPRRGSMPRRCRSDATGRRRSPGHRGVSVARSNRPGDRRLVGSRGSQAIEPRVAARSMPPVGITPAEVVASRAHGRRRSLAGAAGARRSTQGPRPEVSPVVGQTVSGTRSPASTRSNSATSVISIPIDRASDSRSAVACERAAVMSARLS